MTFITALFAVLSPIIVAFLRKPTWPKPVVSLLAVVVITVIYTLGSWLDGTLTWPIGSEFLTGLLAMFGSQQFAYFFVYRDNASISELERF